MNTDSGSNAMHRPYSVSLLRNISIPPQEHRITETFTASTDRIESDILGNDIKQSAATAIHLHISLSLVIRSDPPGYIVNCILDFELIRYLAAAHTRGGHAQQKHFFFPFRII